MIVVDGSSNANSKKCSNLLPNMDADGQHRGSDAKKICRIAQDNPETLVLGSRKLRENVPVRSRFGNTVTRLVYRISTGQKV